MRVVSEFMVNSDSYGNAMPASGFAPSIDPRHPHALLWSHMPTLGVDLAEDILALKRDRNAVILAHNYQVKEIQEIADFVGDSLGLSFQAATTDAEVIAFCGVHFMAETAKILNPSKRVVLPGPRCGMLALRIVPCRQARCVSEGDVRIRNYYVIAYINCSAGVKALSDVIVTSGNALKIVEAAPQIAISSLFPTKISAHGSRRKPGVTWICGGATVMSMWNLRRIDRSDPTRVAACARRRPPGMHRSSPNAGGRSLLDRKDDHLLQGEPSERLRHCHRIRACSTDFGGRYLERCSLPGRRITCACADCRFMKMNTLEKLHDALLNLEPKSSSRKPTRARAEMPIRRMLELSA